MDDLFRINVRVLDIIACAAFPGECRHVALVALSYVSTLGEYPRPTLSLHMCSDLVFIVNIRE